MTNINSDKIVNKVQYMEVRITVPWGFLVGRWYGNRAVRPILALHGWLDNLGTWNNLLPLLPKHLGVLCIDFPGHGHSTKLPKGIIYNYVDFLGVILIVMEEYKWSKVSLLGHSMGGRMAFTFAAVYPQKVDMIILIDVLHPHYDSPDVYIKNMRVNVDKYKVEDERLSNIEFHEPPSINPIFGAVMASRIINVPFLVVKATASTTITNESHEVIDILRKNNTHFELHEVQGTHHIHLNNAKAVATIVNSFIYRHRPSSKKSLSMYSEPKIDHKDINNSKLCKL